VTINGSKALTTVKGSGEYISSIKIDGKDLNSAVIPSGLTNTKKVEITLGIPRAPYLKEITAGLKNVRYDKTKKEYSFSCEGNITAIIISPLKPVSLNINGIAHNDLLKVTKKESIFIVTISPIIINEKDGKDVIYSLAF
jgi:hypothetical protein